MSVILKKHFAVATILASALCAPLFCLGQAAAAPSRVAISLGTVKTVSGNSIALTTDAGTELNVTVEPDARLLRTAPGRKDLQGATPIALSDVQAGDRMLARGKLADDGKTVLASSLVVMKREDIAQKQQQEQEDWRNRGVSGVVKSVDPATGTIIISTGGLAAKMIAIKISQSTMLRRYSPDSVKFDDAKPGTLDQIKPGDQLRARGDRSPDGAEVTADEVVSGVFRNIAGTVISADPANNTVTISDLLSKKPVTVKIGPGSQLRELPQMMAIGIAARLKRGPAAQAGAGSSAGASPESMHQGWQRPGEGASAEVHGGAPHGGDFQQMLNHMPTVSLSDLKKGDAVILVTTEGGETSRPTAITLLTGVEPILTAAPDQAAMSLSPWSLGAPTGDAGP
jgi:hypothetical protein